MENRRVVITGLGVVSSIGTGAETFAEALFQGKSRVAEITSFNPNGFDHKNACEIDDFNGVDWLQHLNPDDVGRASQFAISASRMAIEDAGLTAASLSREGCGVHVGTTDGESQEIDKITETWVHDGFSNIDPKRFRRMPASNLSLSIAKEFRLTDSALTFSSACAAGNYAIGYAYDRIKTEPIDYMLCGAADSVCRKTFAGFFRLGTIAPKVCQPFDQNRKGILTGEGAGMLLLESLESAKNRNARIYGEVLGYGLNCSADHMTMPNRQKIAECIRLAHKNAGISSNQVDYVSAHGTGTVSNDLAEAGAIRDVFDDPCPPVSSIKSMIGHTMGAASALASVACIKTLEKGVIPPTINVENPDPACEIDCVPNHARNVDARIVQNNGFAFGGNNCIIVFGKYDEEQEEA